MFDEAICISHNTNSLAKSMNPTILSLAMGKLVGQTRFFNLGMVIIPREKTLNSNLLNFI